MLSEGQEISVFVAGVDKQGRVKLEWKDKPTTTQAEQVQEHEITSTLDVDDLPEA